jgi:hypothetical protein
MSLLLLLKTAAVAGPDASDDFNRANGDPGSNWDTVTGASRLQIVSNSVRGNSSFTPFALAWSASAFNFGDDQESSVEYVATGTSDQYGPAVRMDASAGTCYAIRASTGGTILVERWASGTNTTIIDTGVGLSLNDVVTLRIVGTTLTTLKNGSVIDTRTDATYSTGQPGIYGFHFGENSTRVDNWEGRNAVATNAYSVGVDLGTFALSGQAVAAGVAGRIDLGTFTLAGFGVTRDVAGRIDLGTFTLAGQAVSRAIAGRIDLGTFTLAGQDVALEFFAGANNFSLGVDLGTFTLAGQAVTQALALGTGAGAFTLAGQAVTRAIAGRIDLGTLGLTGFGVTRDVAGRVDLGTFGLTGRPVAQALALGTGAGAFGLTGLDVLLQRGRMLLVDGGAFALVGRDVTFPVQRALLLEPASILLSGQDVALQASRSMLVDAGAFTWDGYDVVLAPTSTIVVLSGVSSVSSTITLKAVPSTVTLKRLS